MPKIIQPAQKAQFTSPRLASARPSQLGRANQNIGKAVTRSAEILNQAVERNAAIQSDRAMADFRLNAQKELKDRQLSAGPGAENFTENFESYLLENKEKLMEGGTSASRARLDSQFGNMQLSMQGQAMNFETTERARHAVNSAEMVFNSNASAMRQNPDFDQLGDILEQNLETANALPIDDSKKEALAIQSNQAAHFEMFNGFLDGARKTKNVGLATELLNDLKDTGKWETAMTEPQFVQTLNRAMALSEQIKNDNKAANVAALTDYVGQRSDARRADLMPDMHKLVDETSTDEFFRKKWHNKLDKADERGNVRSKTRHISLKDRAVLSKNVEANKDEKGNFFENATTADVFKSELALHDKNLKTRRAEYAIEGNETLPELYTNWKEDPTAQNINAYLNAQTAEQTRMGIRPGNVRLYKNSDIAGLKFKFESIEKTAAGANVYFEEIKSLQKQGDMAWGLLQRQLVEEEVLTGTSALVSGMSDIRDDAMMLTILRAERTEDDLKKVLTKQQITDIEEMAKVKNADMMQTLKHNPSGLKAALEIERASVLGAMQLMADGTASDVDDALTRSYTPFSNKHELIKNYRVPIKFQPSQVQRGEETVLSDLKNHIGDGLGVTSIFINNTQLSSDEASRRLSEEGQWVTNGDESGLTLTWSNGSAVWYTDENNQMKLVTKQFDELQDIGLSEFEKGARIIGREDR